MLPDTAIRELVRRSRAAQGLPPTITDPVALAKLAAIVHTVRSVT